MYARIEQISKYIADNISLFSHCHRQESQARKDCWNRFCGAGLEAELSVWILILKERGERYTFV